MAELYLQLDKKVESPRARNLTVSIPSILYLSLACLAQAPVQLLLTSTTLQEVFIPLSTSSCHSFNSIFSLMVIDCLSVFPTVPSVPGKLTQDLQCLADCQTHSMYARNIVD